MSSAKFSSDNTSLGYVDSSDSSSSTASTSRTVFVPQSEKGDKGMKSKTDLTNLNPLLDLMFVTIVVFLDTFVLIALSYILKSKCPNGHRFPLKSLHLCLESY